MKRPPTLRQLRVHAIARSIGTGSKLLDAISAFGFVQLDPIRAPARAADLILRQRVRGYRAGDLDRAYPDLPLAEDYVHVYGAMPVAVQRLLHPRARSLRWRVEREHPRLAARILAHVGSHGETHPRDLATTLGRVRTQSGWGGQSSATTRILEALQHRGHLKVARRAAGIKVYAATAVSPAALTAAERAREILMLLLRLYAPLPEATLRQLARMVPESSVPAARRNAAVARLCAGDRVTRLTIDGMTWLLPADEAIIDETPDHARLLAPFDPIVWDRRRFAAFWGWDYRFEAYMPPSKRRFGYYAMPLLWRDEVIGWANTAMRGDTLVVAPGYAGAPPRSAGYRRELEDEAAGLAHCVGAARFSIEKKAPPTASAMPE